MWLDLICFKSSPVLCVEIEKEDSKHWYLYRYHIYNLFFCAAHMQTMDQVDDYGELHPMRVGTYNANGLGNVKRRELVINWLKAKHESIFVSCGRNLCTVTVYNIFIQFSLLMFGLMFFCLKYNSYK